MVKFDGCYHGAGDSLLVKAGSGVATLGLPDSPGVPADLARHTLTLPWNDLAAARALFAARGATLAAVITEPVVGNMGVLLPRPGYLEGLQELCRQHGALFIVDEVMTGFRLAPGGACGLYGLAPDLVTLGKVIGGGLPVGAFGGRAEVMDQVAPAGPVYQAGTLSGNPLAMAAGLATLELLTPESYQRLEALGARLASGLAEAAREAGVALQVNRAGSMITAFFADAPVIDAESARLRRPGPLRPLLPRHAGARGLPAAVPARGRLPLARAHRRGRRPDHGRRWRGPGGGRRRRGAGAGPVRALRRRALRDGAHHLD